MEAEGETMKLSARNIISGMGTRIATGATTSIVHLDGNGTEITASITSGAVAGLGLAVGRTARAVDKAPDVMIAVD
jgi:molybdopterin-binding protein